VKFTKKHKLIESICLNQGSGAGTGVQAIWMAAAKNSWETNRPKAWKASKTL